MRFVLWIDVLLVLFAFILIQNTDPRKNLDHPEDYDEDDELEFREYRSSFSEVLVFTYPKLFAACANSSVGFLKTLFLLFKKLFVENDVTSLENLSVLSEMFNTGHEMQDNFLEMIYTLMGEPEDDSLIKP